MIRPSSLPMVAKCARFRGEAGEYAEDGTRRHAVLAALCRLWATGITNAEYEAKSAELLASLPEGDADGVRWAADYIQLKAPLQDYPLVIEEKRSWMRPDFTTATGTPDSTCGPDLFDFKWRMRDYAPQMADYALAVLAAGHPVCRVHILFGEPRRFQLMEFDRDAAEALVEKVLDHAATNPEPSPNEYCGWCADCIRCKPYLALAGQVVRGYSEDVKLTSWHPSQIETGAELADALRVARLVKKWCASVEHHAKDGVVKKGLTLPGFELATKKGKQYCANTAEAFGLAGLPQDEFLKCCDLRLNTSKKYPDKLGIVSAYAAMHGIKTAPAKRDMLKKLDPVLKQTAESKSLRATGENDDEESE